MKLTLPSAEPGMCAIVADGRKVGHVVDIWDDGPGHQAWEAHLVRSDGGRTKPCRVAANEAQAAKRQARQEKAA